MCVGEDCPSLLKVCVCFVFFMRKSYITNHGNTNIILWSSYFTGSTADSL